jgi:hypothetical protein
VLVTLLSCPPISVHNASHQVLDILTLRDLACNLQSEEKESEEKESEEKESEEKESEESE